MSSCTNTNNTVVLNLFLLRFVFMIIWRANRRICVLRNCCRWMLTSKGCQRQQILCDVPMLTQNQMIYGSVYPWFFTITTDDKEVPSWVSKRLHMLKAYEFEPNCRVNVTKMITPLYSIAMGGVASCTQLYHFKRAEQLMRCSDITCNLFWEHLTYRMDFMWTSHSSPLFPFPKRCRSQFDTI